MSALNPVYGNGNGNGNGRTNTFVPVLVPKPAVSPQQETYLAALELVQMIDMHLTAGTQHYRTRAGVLLRTLDQVVNAILADDMVIEVPVYRQEKLARAA